MRGLLLLVLLAQAQDSAFWARAYPRFPRAGDDVVVMCRIPRHPENRSLVIGLSNWTESEYALEGDQAKVYHERPFRGVGCDADGAFCEVRRADGSRRRAVAPLTVRCW